MLVILGLILPVFTGVYVSRSFEQEWPKFAGWIFAAFGFFWFMRFAKKHS